MKLRNLAGGSVVCLWGAWASLVTAQEAATALRESKTRAGTIRQTPITLGTTLHLESQALGDTREINVWLPPSYAEGEQRYPVLYLMDGALDQDFHHISGLAQLATINRNYEALIVVGIQTKNRIMELTQQPLDPRYVRDPPTAGQSAKMMELVRSEVIPLIESRYRTGERRVLMGESLAGLFVLEMFLRHPETFTDYVSVSPSLWWDDQALAKSAGDLLANHDDTARRLYLTMADEGGTMQAGLDLVVAAIEKETPAGLIWYYVDRRQTETHASIYHGAALDAFRKLFGLPAPDYGEPPWYLVEGGQPPEAESREDE
ncbi:MAG: alpha/beta hydrolase-fold protein [Acidobacteriota bacterium]